MKVLVTGAAGFIGYHVAQLLLDRGDDVVGLDNLNDYYDVNLKRARLERLRADNNFSFEKMDLADRQGMEVLFKKGGFQRVIHLGAQAGVRYSLTHPHTYIDSNVTGTLHVLEGCRHSEIEHLVFASTSSVYGANTHMPYSVHDNVDHPLSLYAATKKANELMAHSYASLYQLPVTGLRFFTVYGPWGRPDMSPMLFTRAILAGEPIDVFNFGKHKRDFTYIDDIAQGVLKSLDTVATPNPDWSSDQPGSGHQQCAVSPVQHRQPGTGGPDALYRVAGGTPGQNGREKPAAHAARRCARHLGRCGGPGDRRGLPADHIPRTGCAPICAVVQGVLPRLTT